MFVLDPLSSLRVRKTTSYLGDRCKAQHSHRRIQFSHVLNIFSIHFPLSIPILTAIFFFLPPFFQNRPITSRRGGPVDIPLKKIGERLGATDDQVLLAWAKAKGAVILT